MIPVRLTLSNACQYDHYVYDYKAGVTGITGRNGAGKTNLIYVLQQFAITGKTKTNKTKKQLLKWGTHNGYTKFEFLHDGLEYTLTRGINTSKIHLKQDDNEWKQAEADKAMTSILGMDAAVFFEVCFVPQGGLWNILEMTHAARMAYFQKLTDAWYAEQLRTMLDKGHKRIPVYPDRSELIEQANENIETYKDIIEKITVQLEAQLTLKKQFDGALPQAQEMLSLMRETDYRLAFDKANKIVADIEAELAAVAKPVEVPTVEYPKELIDKKHAYDMWALKNKAYNNKKADNTQAITDLAELQKTPVMLFPKDDIIAFDEQIKKMQNSLAGICPTCQQTLPGSTDIDKEKITAELNIALADRVKAQDIYDSHEKAYHEYSNKIVVLEGTIHGFDDDAEQTIVGPTIVFDAKELELAELAWDVYSKYQQELVAYNIQIKAIDERAILAKQALQDIIDTKYIKDESHTQTQQLIANAKKVDETVTQLKTQKQIEENNLNNAEDQIKLYDADVAKGKEADDLRKKFERCRDILHRDKLPKIVMSNMLVGLNHHMNEMLSYFHMDFDAMLDEDFNFLVACPDNDQATSDDLSGGQKVILAIAFHIGLAKLLSGSIPFMVLDEPTNHVDMYNKPVLRDALMRLRGAGSEGTEYMIVTHDEILQPTFNREIKIIKN